MTEIYIFRQAQPTEIQVDKNGQNCILNLPSANGEVTEADVDTSAAGDAQLARQTNPAILQPFGG